jgi:hypothetical protein
MNTAVTPGPDTDCEPGITEIETTSEVGFVPPPIPPPETTSVADAVLLPLKPFMLAVIVVVPEVNAVARPEVLIDATAGTDEVHVTWLLTSCEDVLPFPWP